VFGRKNVRQLSRLVPLAVSQPKAARLTKATKFGRLAAHRGTTHALIALPFLAATLRGIVVEWHPGSDNALIELRTWDVGTHTPLLGTYSRMGWSHPGPLMFWLLAAPYRVFGANGSALLVGVACLNFVAAAVLVQLLRRRGGVAGALFGAAAVLGFVFARPDLIVSPWNPHLALLPFALTIVAAWSAACGDPLALRVLVAAGSFTVQAHVGYAPVVAASMLWGVGWFLWSLRDVERRQGVRATLLASAAIALVAWAPVLWDQVAGSGNLGKLWSYFGRPDRKVLGLSGALGIAADALAPWTLWAGLPRALQPLVVVAPAPLLLVPLTGLGLGLLAAWRLRSESIAMLMGLLTVLALVAPAALASIDGPPWGYLFGWLWIVGIVVWLSLVGLLGMLATPLVGSLAGRSLPGGALVVMAAFASITALRTAALPLDDPAQSRAIGVFATAAKRSLRPGTAVSLRQVGGWPVYPQGIGVELVKAGYPLVVPPTQWGFGEHRKGDPASAPNQLVVAVGFKHVAGHNAQRNLVRLAALDPAAERVGTGALLGGPLGRWLWPAQPVPARLEPVALFAIR
jgi:hypothetical protein